jgi:nucleoside 2-deoxyribosyltransferase
MNIIYSNQIYNKQSKSIFLAGPSPRNEQIVSWRKEAIKYFEKYHFEGTLFVPEKEFNSIQEEGNVNNMSWDQKALGDADLILFWIPREIPNLLGLTTNVEFGYFLNKKPIIYGRPDISVRNEYIDWIYECELNVKPINDLDLLVKKSIDYFNI